MKILKSRSNRIELNTTFVETNRINFLSYSVESDLFVYEIGREKRDVLIDWIMWRTAANKDHMLSNSFLFLQFIMDVHISAFILYFVDR